MNYTTELLAMIVKPVDCSLYDERATTITRVDESGGEFVEVEQECGKIRIEKAEWPTLCDAINQMLLRCKEQE